MKSPVLSVACVVLTKNEEINIERCLRSVAWCAETVVVDSGSTDHTCELAAGCGAKVFTHLQPGSFNVTDQRNWALEKTGLSSDWVLFMDADEEVPSDLRIAIEVELGANADRLNAYELTPKYLFWGRWLKRTQGYPNWHERLILRGATSFAGSGYWEHLDHRAKVGRISISYNHYANSKGFSDWLERHDRYSSWDAERIVTFLEIGGSEALGTERKKKLRRLAARLWPLRPWARFFQMYILRLGFLEGFTAFVFCLLYFFYEWMTVVKIMERRRQQQGLPL